ncbi:MAG TPA: ABC transporter substrate-binding protein [Stellaceae bacterium]|jgi:phospholipid transport system substrate-binding protein|nr:ABC transporter substrate-binding protein [Stellaceae bacterium]
MMERRSFLFAATAALTVAWRGAESRAATTPAATLNSFYDTLLAVMKDGPKLGFVGRRQKLAPAITQAFDLALMTRLVVGLPWPSLTVDEQKQLVSAFAEFSIATYANQFDDFSGEKFEVDPKAAPAPGNDVIVKTKLIQSNGEPVQLDYLLRQEQAEWRIIDVFLSGTISQLAARRSEFSGILREQGARGLIAVLKEKTQALATSNG